MRKIRNLWNFLYNVINRIRSIIRNIFIKKIIIFKSSEKMKCKRKNKLTLENKIYGTLKEEVGSITSMVTVTIIFFITILSSTYMLMAVQRKSQLKSQLSTREAYQEEIDNANEIYYTLIGDDASVNIKEEYEENTYTNKNVYVYSRNNKKFSVSKDGNQIATGQSSYTLTENGIYTISINKDTELEEHIVKIDKTQPTINNIEIADITSNSLKIKVNVEDSLSGIKQIRYSVDDGKKWIVPTENITECTITDIDTMFTDYKIKVETEDVAGNAATKEQTQTAKFSGMKIGDYVAYQYDKVSEKYSLPSTQSGYSSDQTIEQSSGLKWRVLNIDAKNEIIDIICDNPTSNTVALGGILGYNNGPYIMNKICEKQYSNKTLNLKARNINLLDIEKQLTENGIKTRNSYSKLAQYGKTKTYTSNTYYPTLYEGQIGSGMNTVSIIQPDITKGNDPYEESKPISESEPTTDKSYKLATGKGLTVRQTLYYMPINTENYGNAYEVLNSSSKYWVAARYVETLTEVARFGIRLMDIQNMDGYGMFDSKIYEFKVGFALRPVVSIQQNILTKNYLQFPF